MLANLLVNGTIIKGLAPLLDGGGVVGGDQGQVNERVVTGSYAKSGNTLEFSDSVELGVGAGVSCNILPYVAGAINYTQMQGLETISGEFTGCTMAIYNYAGTSRVCHVDTAKTSEGDAPSKGTWEKIKKQSGFELADEVSTVGMLGRFLDSVDPDPSYARLSVLCVATPVVGISCVYVVKEGQDYRVVGRVKT